MGSFAFILFGNAITVKSAHNDKSFFVSESSFQIYLAEEAAHLVLHHWWKKWFSAIETYRGGWLFATLSKTTCHNYYQSLTELGGTM
jgi:hypothetical protein